MWSDLQKVPTQKFDQLMCGGLWIDLVPTDMCGCCVLIKDMTMSDIEEFTIIIYESL